MKKIISLLLAFVLALSLAACAATQTKPYESVNIRLGGLKGPTSMGMAKLLDDAENGRTANTYTFTMTPSAGELTPQLIKGELDILAVPVNVASILYNQTEGSVQLVAASTLGVLYITEKGGETVTDVRSLAGKTLYATGKGATPEYALAYLLAQNGLTLGEDVTVEWKSEPSEIVALMAQEEHAIAMLPSPSSPWHRASWRGCGLRWICPPSGTRWGLTAASSPPVFWCARTLPTSTPKPWPNSWRNTPPARITPTLTPPKPPL